MQREKKGEVTARGREPNSSEGEVARESRARECADPEL